MDHHNYYVRSRLYLLNTNNKENNWKVKMRNVL